MERSAAKPVGVGLGGSGALGIRDRAAAVASALTRIGVDPVPDGSLAVR